MIEIEKPQIECVETPGDASYGKYVIEPLERGYGTTLGNALRRIMLSSLPGTAATSIKIAGVQHEFSTIPGVKEDVTEIVLNVKQLLTKLHCESAKTVFIEAVGPCVVTAGDIKSDGEVEVLNPELKIATLDVGATLSMEISLSHGRGYVSADKNKALRPAAIGVIPIDSIYTPVYKVNYTVENTRVGASSDYDKLTLEVWTDGTISAKEAVSLGAKVLNEHLNLFVDLSDEAYHTEIMVEKDDNGKEKILEMTITYEIDQVSWKLTSKEYGDWISNVKGKWKFSEDKVREYVEDIASRYDTYGVPRNFRTHNGDVITLANTWYGWMIDVDGETEELMKLLEAGESTTHTPPFDCYAAVYHDGGDDIGDSYIECDFGQQHVYAYVDGNLVWDSDCVTGSLANNGKYRTPEGVYTILYKKTPAVLIGDDYETPVTYWMPFIGELGIGFHDASWRSSFGGDIYKNSGSHGCVNLPVSAAEQLFNIVYDGMPVICYY